MPSAKGMELLVRRTRPSTKEWYDLIEARRELVKPHLSVLRLGRLGDHPCIKGPDGNNRGFGPCSPPVMTETDLDGGTQGIFETSWGSTASASATSDEVWLWGLTRGNLWVLVRVMYYEIKNATRTFDHASNVTIWASDPKRIVQRTGVTPMGIWMELGSAVRRWCAFREEQYQRALRVQEVIGAEDAALAAIPEE